MRDAASLTVEGAKLRVKGELEKSVWIYFVSTSKPVIAAISVDFPVKDAGVTEHLKCNPVSLFGWIIHGFEEENHE